MSPEFFGMYVLDDDNNPVVCRDMKEWGEFMEKDDRRRVNFTRFVIKDVAVSTVFLGLDHSYEDSARPILFETMIFGGKHDGFQMRYCTWDEAVKGHTEAVKRVKGKRWKNLGSR